jgi:hypothetical protein
VDDALAVVVDDDDDDDGQVKFTILLDSSLAIVDDMLCVEMRELSSCFFVCLGRGGVSFVTVLTSQLKKVLFLLLAEKDTLSVNNSILCPRRSTTQLSWTSTMSTLL